jgi:hypothetical protein
MIPSPAKQSSAALFNIHCRATRVQVAIKNSVFNTLQRSARSPFISNISLDVKVAEEREHEKVLHD